VDVVTSTADCRGEELLAPPTRRILRSLSHSKSQRLVTDPRYDRIYRGGRPGLKGPNVVLAVLDRGVVGEDCNHELRRIPIPRTPVNKGMNKAHSPLGCYLYAAPPFSACFLLVSEELRELRMQTCEEALRDGRSEFICRTKAD
jgi:hypothetical protein